MKTKLTASLLLACAALFLAAPAVFADTVEDEPARFAPKQRLLSEYESLDKKSPFEFDPVKDQVAAAVDPFEGVSLAGYCGSGNTMSVYLLTGKGKENKRVTVYGDGATYKKFDKSGFRVIGITPGKTLKTTVVILEKDGVQGKVMFEEDTLRSKGGGAPGQPQPQQMVGPNGQIIPRPIIPKPGGNPNQPQAQYQAPAAVIPGQSNTPQNPQMQQPTANTVPAQNVGNMTNQQLVNHLVGQPGQPQANPPAVVPQPAPATGGEQRSPGQSPRRRVVLPTQQ